MRGTVLGEASRTLQKSLWACSSMDMRRASLPPERSSREPRKPRPFGCLQATSHPITTPSPTSVPQACGTELKGLFVQILLLAREAGFLELGNISLDGTKVHADASKSKAVSYKRLIEIEARLKAEIDELFTLAEKADQRQIPEGMDLPAEIARREDRLRRLAEAKVVLEARAAERFAAEQAEYESKQRDRQAHEERTGKKPKGRSPQPPTPGPKDADQFNFTDPDSRIMKNSQNDGFDQHYNAQVAVDQDALLIVGCSVSNHPNDPVEVAPTVTSIPPELGAPGAALRAALDTGYFIETNISLLQEAGIDPYIATGRTSHHGGWRAFFEEAGPPPPEEATVREQMAYKLRTTVGKALYRRRKCTVEPTIGQIEVPQDCGIGSSPYAGCPTLPESGVWSAWRSPCAGFTRWRVRRQAIGPISKRNRAA